jgi:hypothetical protein
MTGDIATVVAEATPYLMAAVSAYGGAVLAKVRDDTADATVGLGRRLVRANSCTFKCCGGDPKCCGSRRARFIDDALVGRG